jgi:ATP-dependent exoDNAse (exonuclease V) alpha subunit
VELTEIVRQNEAWTKEAIQHVRAGDLGKAIQAYKEHGCLRHDAKTRDEAEAQLIAAWKEQGIKNPKDNLIIAQTNAEVDRLNAAAQTCRQEAGKLGWGYVTVGSGEKIHKGDRILFTENRKDINPLFVKSQFATVTHIDMLTRKVTVEVDGKSHTLGERFKHHATMLVKTALNELHADFRLPVTKLTNKVTFSLRDFDSIRLSYAVTTHRSQSMTLDRDAFILAGGSMQNLEMSVVQLSRAKNNSHIFTDQQTVAGLEELERQMKRSQEKTSAHSVARENEVLERERSLHLSL